MSKALDQTWPQISLFLSGLCFLIFSIINAFQPSELRSWLVVCLCLVLVLSLIINAIQVRKVSPFLSVLVISIVCSQFITLSWIADSKQFTRTQALFIYSSFFLAIYCFLRQKISQHILSVTSAYKSKEDYQNLTNNQEKLSALELTSNHIVTVEKGESLSHDMLLVEGQAIFDILKSPLHFSRVYKQEGDYVPAGSCLYLGQVKLQVCSAAAYEPAKNLESYIQSLNFPIENRSLIILIPVVILLIFLCATGPYFQLAFVIISFLSILLFIDLWCLQRLLPAWIQAKFVSKGIFFGNFHEINFSDQVNLSEDHLVKVGSLEIYSDDISAERVALIIFYLLSSASDPNLILIREELVENYLDTFLANPLVEIESFGEGYTALLEGAEVVFGTEQFLLEQAVVLNTTDVIGRSDEINAYYLAINKEVFAAIEVKDLKRSDITKHFKSLEAFNKSLSEQTEAQSENNQSVSFSSSGNLNLVKQVENQPKTSSESQEFDQPIQVYFSKNPVEISNFYNQPTIIYNKLIAGSLNMPFKVLKYLNQYKRNFVISVLTLLGILMSFVSSEVFTVQIIIIASVVYLICTAYFCLNIERKIS